MNTLRDAAQQALEALKIAQDDCIHGEMAEPSPIFENAITALKAALAEPEPEPVATVAENATTEQPVSETPPSDYRRGYWDGFEIGKREGRIEAEDALAEPTVPSDCADSHQPVAWMVYTEGGTSAYVTDNPNDLVGAYRALPLYTTPPQRQPLTIEQITAIWAQLYPGAPLTRLALKIVRAVEAHRGIGGDK